MCVEQLVTTAASDDKGRAAPSEGVGRYLKLARVGDAGGGSDGSRGSSNSNSNSSDSTAVVATERSSSKPKPVAAASPPPAAASAPATVGQYKPKVPTKTQFGNFSGW
jgi:hypothetical protein